MAVLTLNKKELEKIIGKINPEMENKISMFGTPVDKITDEEIAIEIFPNRPDLLSLQGFSRAFLAYMGKKSGIKKYKLEPPEKNYKVTIDKSVKRVRPYTTCAIVKNLKFDDSSIKQIIDIQEKLHLTYGRDRKKLAIGIYPLEQIKLPITFLAKRPEEIKFIPLEFPREINGKQILSQHPVGREYAHLLKDCEVFPLFEDANNEVLSMPPIINSDKTGKITEKTKEVFIECSGFNLEYLKKALNMIVSALAEMGGKIYSMEIHDLKEGKYISPNLEPEKLAFSIEFVNKTLGLNLNEKEIIRLLEKMNIEYQKNDALNRARFLDARESPHSKEYGFQDSRHEKNKNESIAIIPAYRTDILHEIDIAEEIAIAYGYENFIPEIPKISTIASESPIEILKRKISEILVGLQLQEISTYHISTKETQFKKIGIKDFKHHDLIEVADSKTERNILRTSLLAQSIEVLSQNSDAVYPQKIFEIGKIFCDDEEKETRISEKESLCISLCHEKANFTEIKQILDYLMRMLNIEYEIKEAEHPSFVPGRCCQVIITNKNSKNPTQESIGIFGEIIPFVLKNNKIKMPVASLEIEIEELMN